MSWPFLPSGNGGWVPSGPGIKQVEVPGQREGREYSEGQKVWGTRPQDCHSPSHPARPGHPETQTLPAPPTKRGASKSPTHPDNPTSLSKISRNLTPFPLPRLVHSPLFSYLLSRGTQVPNASRRTLWALEEEEKPLRGETEDSTTWV